MKLKRWVKFAVVATIAIVILIYIIKPIKYLPEETIKRILLKQTPIKCDKSTVLKYVENQGFKIEEKADGAYNMGRRSSYPIGNSFIQVTIGEYCIFRCFVEAVWIFDSNDKLIYLDVWKEIDAM